VGTSAPRCTSPLEAALTKLADLAQRPAAVFEPRAEHAATRLELVTGIVARFAGGVGAELRLAEAVVVSVAPLRLALAALVLAAGVLAAGIASAAATGPLGARADETALGGRSLRSQRYQRPAEAE
jgi:hypothetical protein